MNRQGWSIVVLLLFSAGCGQGVTKWNSFPVPIYADSTVTSNANAMSDLQDAMNFWEDKAGKQLFDYKGEYSGSTPYSGSPLNPGTVNNNVILFQSPWPLAEDVIGRTTVTSDGNTIQNALVQINGDIQYCTGDCTGVTGLNSERRDMAHELGHFIGLQHVTDITNIMYPVIQPGGTLNNLKIDDATFQQLVN